MRNGRGNQSELLRLLQASNTNVVSAILSLRCLIHDLGLRLWILVMGRHDLRPLRVHHTANQLLAADRISNLPSWHSVIGSIPPAQTLVRTQRIQHNKWPKPRKLNTRIKAKKASKLFQPINIAYREDTLRSCFFGDHPWELARPRVVLENDGRDYEKNDWSKLIQPGRPVTGER